MFNHYFGYPNKHSENHITKENKNIIKMLNSNEEVPQWINVLRELPKELLEALIVELKMKNFIIDIGKSNYPDEGSIVVTLKNKFCEVAKKYSPKVVYHNPNDPHYWREELSQNHEGICHLLIC
jgi:hypothetical protein